ncbi:hypothetical protein [Silvibacterium dinghuense]|uniref:DUF3352 domain-containing protein n=1 Tax=Silvibacterium dinghuense TaxID=1560006 RepID=A0A4Q1SJU4_9BACT|nr:hypothetical protein [Silvibacterium dinghuense]RXS97713.1 hypothetical protein ESZ00_07535 [Silvibacterium dinghuense]GGH01369.1 hypothetical protein GCM10011586_16270 [Silvibacterium dinghuense]
MRRRTRLTIAIVVLFLLLVGAAIYLRKKAPPEAARLLPESDGIVYVDLRPLRAATHFDRHPVAHDPDYQKFIDATGIQPERDLDEAAFALHRMSDPKGPNGPVAFSEVFVGHFDGRRVAAWLQGESASTESYAGHDIYSITNDGRTVRVALLSYDMIAVSNTPSAEQIHSILDRYRTAALPFTGSTLLAKHYVDVPLLSLAWGIGQIGLPLGDNDGRLSVMGLSLPLAQDATFVASLSWAGKTHLRVEEIASSDADAKAAVDSLGTLLSLARAAADQPGISTDPAEAAVASDTRTLLDSARIDQHHNRAVLTAAIPDDLLQRLVAVPATLGRTSASH